MATFNANPVVYHTQSVTAPAHNQFHNSTHTYDWNQQYKLYTDIDNNQQDELNNDIVEESTEPITAEDIFDSLRNLNDPEHPLTLEQLNVCQLQLIQVIDTAKQSLVHIRFTPTIPHCGMATLIGLSIRVKMLRALPSRFKVIVEITSGTHASEYAINKQLNDKERVSAALENETLLDVVNKCIAKTDNWPSEFDIANY